MVKLKYNDSFILETVFQELKKAEKNSKLELRISFFDKIDEIMKGSLVDHFTKNDKTRILGGLPNDHFTEDQRQNLMKSSIIDHLNKEEKQEIMTSLNQLTERQKTKIMNSSVLDNLSEYQKQKVRSSSLIGLTKVQLFKNLVIKKISSLQTMIEKRFNK